MKTTDIFNNPNKSKKINESLHKTFGRKINFESFDIPKLEDARNKLRTQIHDARSNSGFNENLENEAFHEAQWMLDAINAELAEREEQVAEGAAGLDAETVEAIMKLKEVYMDKGMEPEEAQDEAAEAFGIDPEELADYLDMQYDNDLTDDMMDSVKNNNDVVAEGEVQQASAIVTAKTMVDRVGRWIDELSGMENETMLQLGDSIRDEFGQEQAKAYLESAAPAIEEALNNLKATREALNASMLILTGEGDPPEMLGAEPEEGGEEDMAEPAAPDEMNAEVPADDEFAAAEPATGGEEEAGRVRRESINYSSRLLKTLAG